MSIQTMSPPEIDGRLQELYGAHARAQHQVDGVRARLARHEAAKRPWDRMSATEVEKAEEQLAELVEQAASLREEARPYQDEYARRGGWPRYYLVQNPGGHVHGSMNCSSCYVSTQYAWLTEYSGMSAEELVELAGERACSVCWQWAPVDVLKRASRLRPDVEAQAARDERQAEKARKAAEKEAKAIAMPDGSPLKVKYHEARTVVSAWREAVSQAADIYWYGEDHPSAPEWQRFVAMAVEALSHKLDRDPEEIAAEIEAKAKAKAKREAKAALKGADAPGWMNAEQRAEAKARIEAVLAKVQ